MTRIAALEAPFEPAVAERLALMMPKGVPPIALFRTFVRNMPMAEAMNGWVGYELSARLSLTMRQRELVIDRITALCRCEYEWGVHILFFADRVGLSAAQVTSLTHGSSGDACWTEPDEQELLAFVDQLHTGATVDDATWASAAEHFDDAQLLDVCLLAGWYHAISFAANAAQVPCEDGALRFADVA